MALQTSYPLRRLPVWAIFKRSYSYVWDYRGAFAVPILVVFLAELPLGLVTARLDSLLHAVPNYSSVLLQLLLLLLLWILLIALSVAFVVGVHRAILLNDVRSGISVLRFDRNALRYFWTSLVVPLAWVSGGFAMWVAGYFGIFVGLMAFIFYLFVVVLSIERLILSLPAAAIGEKDRYAMSWQAARGNVLRLLAVSILVAVPPIVLSEIVDLIDPPEGSDFFGFATGAAVDAITIPVFAAMLSLCYDVLVRGGGPGPRQDAAGQISA